MPKKLFASTPKLSETMKCGTSNSQNLKRHLNTTSFFTLTSTSTAAKNSKIEFDINYSKYLQAVLKKEIADKEILEKQIDIKKRQITTQRLKLFEVEAKKQDLTNEIKSICIQADIGAKVKTATFNYEYVNDFCLKYNIMDTLEAFLKMLYVKSTQLKIKNIKMLTRQEEYDRLLKALQELKEVSIKFVKSNRNYEEIQNLSNSISKFNKIHENVLDLVKNVDEIKEDVSYRVLRSMSNEFAEKEFKINPKIAPSIHI